MMWFALQRQEGYDASHHKGYPAQISGVKSARNKSVLYTKYAHCKEVEPNLQMSMQKKYFTTTTTKKNNLCL